MAVEVRLALFAGYKGCVLCFWVCTSGKFINLTKMLTQYNFRRKSLIFGLISQIFCQKN